jgi:hypothetical protein
MIRGIREGGASFDICVRRTGNGISPLPDVSSKRWSFDPYWKPVRRRMDDGGLAALD